MHNGMKYTIGIVANAISDEGKNIYLNKFINLFKPLSEEIFVIDGDLPKSHNKKIHIIDMKIGSGEKSTFSLFKRFILIQLKSPFYLLKIIKYVDILIFFGAVTISSIMLAKFTGKKIIILAGGSAWKTIEAGHIRKSLGICRYAYINIFKTIERIGFALSDKVVVESESAISFLELNNYENKIAVASNMYLDLDKYRITKKIEYKKNIVGFISRLNEGKGIMNFVYAIPLILREFEGVEFLIGGDGLLFNRVKSELEDKDLIDKVTLIGWIPNEIIPKYLNDLKLLVFPSYSEGTPNIISESMACGVVVLATAVGGIPDLVLDGKTGFILENNDPETIAKQVILVLNDPNLGEIAANARRYVEERYTYDAIVERFERIIY